MLLSLLSLLGGCLSTPPRELPMLPADFSGTWMTDDRDVRKGGFFGKIVLVQEGETVSGRFGGVQWVLRGRVQGRRLVGRWWWKSPADATFEDTQPAFRGEMEWTLSADGKTFTGWGILGNGRRVVWTGRRWREKE
ncbi:MAG: hypothetical protein ACYTHM_00865 [Planctomycetota bacterium]|jgi:hypothetical protein